MNCEVLTIEHHFHNIFYSQDLCNMKSKKRLSPRKQKGGTPKQRSQSSRRSNDRKQSENVFDMSDLFNIISNHSAISKKINDTDVWHISKLATLKKDTLTSYKGLPSSDLFKQRAQKGRMKKDALKLFADKEKVKDVYWCNNSKELVILEWENFDENYGNKNIYIVNVESFDITSYQLPSFLSGLQTINIKVHYNVERKTDAILFYTRTGLYVIDIRSIKNNIWEPILNIPLDAIHHPIFGGHNSSYYRFRIAWSNNEKYIIRNSSNKDNKYKSFIWSTSTSTSNILVDKLTINPSIIEFDPSSQYIATFDPNIHMLHVYTLPLKNRGNKTIFSMNMNVDRANIKWCPQGDYFIVAANNSLYMFEEWGLLFVEKLPLSDIVDVAWHPDGSVIAISGITACKNGGDPYNIANLYQSDEIYNENTIYVILYYSIETRSIIVRYVFANNDMSRLSWSPNGEKLAFTISKRLCFINKNKSNNDFVI